MDRSWRWSFVSAASPAFVSVAVATTHTLALMFWHVVKRARASLIFWGATRFAADEPVWKQIATAAATTNVSLIGLACSMGRIYLPSIDLNSMRLAIAAPDETSEGFIRF